MPADSQHESEVKDSASCSDVPSTSVLTLENVSKTYPGQQALKRLSLTLNSGEVHALIGHNGSGKSTLIKILSGYHRPDPGAIAAIDGKATPVPMIAEALGARFVHQDLGLVASLNSAENLSLVNGYERRTWVTARRERQRAESWLSNFDLKVDLRLPVGELPPLQRRLLAIARALTGEGWASSRLVVLDEPTDGLPVREAKRVLDFIREIAEDRAVLFVSHKLDEVLAIAHRITVLRDGQVVASWPRPCVARAGLISALTGGAGETSEPRLRETTTPAKGGAPVLVGQSISAGILDRFSIAICRGEIVGIAGLEGSGREELLYLLFGAIPWRTGTLIIGSKSYSQMTPQAALRAGMSFVPRDRAAEGGMGQLTVRENILVTKPLARRWFGWLGLSHERREVRMWSNRCGVRPDDPEIGFGLLSGGNQQKVIMARALRSSPRALLVNEPFQGIDVGTRFALIEFLRATARAGSGVVIAAADPADLVEVCDRVIVLRAGVQAGELVGESLTAAHISAVAFG